MGRCSPRGSIKSILFGASRNIQFAYFSHVYCFWFVSLLSDGSLLAAIQEAIGEATEEIITRFPELAHESASQTVARLDAHAAAQAERDDHGAFETYDNCICGAHSYLQIWASGADMNDRCGFTLPSGAMAQDCPLPNFGLPDYQHDGFQITLCTKCGRVYKFDTAEVALAIEELEEELAEAE